MPKTFIAIAYAACILTACSSNNSAADRTANKLEAAADQSDPAAAESLKSDAAVVRNSGVTVGNESDPNGTVQNAMENAGEAQLNRAAR
jgi:hypothetical protein